MAFLELLSPLVKVSKVCSSLSEIGECCLQYYTEYWVDLGRSTIFRGRKVIECLWRIHDDILKVPPVTFWRRISEGHGPPCGTDDEPTGQPE